MSRRWRRGGGGGLTQRQVEASPEDSRRRRRDKNFIRTENMKTAERQGNAEGCFFALHAGAWFAVLFVVLSICLFIYFDRLTEVGSGSGRGNEKDPGTNQRTRARGFSFFFFNAPALCRCCRDAPSSDDYFSCGLLNSIRSSCSTHEDMRIASDAKC